MRRLPVVVVLFAAWTAYVWATRLSNLAGDDGDGWGRSMAIALAATFVAIAAVVGVLWFRRRPALVPWVTALAVLTIVVWLPRMVLLSGRDHSGAFKAVHIGLGMVSMALAVLARRAVNRGVVPSRSPAPSR